MMSRRWWMWLAMCASPAVWSGRDGLVLLGVAVVIVMFFAARPSSWTRRRHSRASSSRSPRHSSFSAETAATRSTKRHGATMVSQGREPQPQRCTVGATNTRPLNGSGPGNSQPETTMTTVVLTCTECDNDIEIGVDRAILRVDVAPTPRAELLFCCPACEAPSVKTVVGDLLTLLLLVGVRPVALSEPTLDPGDVAPERPAFTPDDLLDWHEQLADVQFVTPWE